MDKILNDFGVNWLLLSAQIVNFLVLLFILNKLLYKPLLKVLQQRKETIAQSLKNAEEIEEKLAKTEEDRVKALDKAATDAKKILQDAQASASQVIAEAHLKAQKDIEVLMQKGQESIRLEKEKMQQEIRGELAGLVTLAMEKVAAKAFDKSSQKKLVDDAVKQI